MRGVINASKGLVQYVGDGGVSSLEINERGVFVQVRTASVLVVAAARAGNASGADSRPSVTANERHDASILHVSNGNIARGSGLTEQPLWAHDLRARHIRKGMVIVVIYRRELT